MKVVRLGLTLTIGLGAFWAAAHVGALLPHDRSVLNPLQASSGASQRMIDLRRYLPVIR
ncbi:hypothetical protein [Sphingobium sp.]|uniref:hypothetical protein n=1 Tax=Sphingobium sp. TaxID=1912891 RepID=UPI0025EDA709|nr:hypothetical protein [Sphingobium sp.]